MAVVGLQMEFHFALSRQRCSSTIDSVAAPACDLS
jgi:hypothetical protein